MNRKEMRLCIRETENAFNRIVRKGPSPELSRLSRTLTRLRRAFKAGSVVSVKGLGTVPPKGEKAIKLAAQRLAAQRLAADNRSRNAPKPNGKKSRSRSARK